MKSMIVTALCAVLLAGFCQAQDTKPAEEMKKFDVMLGSWEGSGTFRESTDVEAHDWTSVQTVTPILNGHAVQEDLRIDARMPAPIVYRSIHAWNPGEKRYLSMGMGNTGVGSTSEFFWIDDHTLTGSMIEKKEGKVVTSQWVVTYEKDSYKLLVRVAENGNDSFTMLEGTYRRSQKTFSADDLEGAALAPPSEEMAAIKGLVGSWTFKSTFVDEPGAEAIEITGHERIRFILGGHALMRECDVEPSKSFPATTKVIGYVIWSPRAHYYLVLSLSNLGMVSLGKMYKHEGSLIFIGMTAIREKPILNRSVIEFSDNGNVMEIWSEMSTGKSKTFRSEESKYERVKPTRKI